MLYFAGYTLFWRWPYLHFQPYPKGKQLARTCNNKHNCNCRSRTHQSCRRRGDRCTGHFGQRPDRCLGPVGQASCRSAAKSAGRIEWFHRLAKSFVKTTRSGNRTINKIRQTFARRYSLSRRPATNSLRICLSRAKRHYPGRTGRRLESRRPRQRGGHYHRQTGNASGRSAGCSAHGPSGGPGRHHLFDRSHARRNDAISTIHEQQSSQESPIRRQVLAGIAEAMGMQQITVEGVPATSHFAQVLVAADYRMKRLGMNLDPPPAGVKLPSYLQMVPTSSSVVSTPRWWMEPKYDPHSSR